MGRGGHLGGSTIISPFPAWREERQRDREHNGERSTVRWAAGPKAEVLAAASETKSPGQKKNIAAKSAKEPKIPHKPHAALIERGALLKAQVAVGILLPTGKLNPDHPANRKDETR